MRPCCGREDESGTDLESGRRAECEAATGDSDSGSQLARQHTTPTTQQGIEDAGGCQPDGRAAVWARYRLLSRKAVNCDLVSAPTFCACACPALYRITVGMPRMPYLPDVDGLASMSSLATVTLPPYSL